MNDIKDYPENKSLKETTVNSDLNVLLAINNGTIAKIDKQTLNEPLLQNGQWQS